MIGSQIPCRHDEHHERHHQGRTPLHPGAGGPGDEGGGEVAQVPHLQRQPPLRLLGDDAPGVRGRPGGPGPVLPAPRQLVHVVTDHQSPKENRIHSSQIC